MHVIQKEEDNMTRFGKKLEEVFTIRAKDNLGSIDDGRTFLGYPSMDEAVVTARELYKELKKSRSYKNPDVLVCFGEFKYESGDVLGEPTCLSVKDLKPKRTLRR